MMRLIMVLIMTLPAPLFASGNTHREVIQGDRGRITLTGKIVAGSCGINMQDRHQTITLPDVAIGQLARGDKSAAAPFSIQLVNCMLLEDAQGTPVFRLGFDGHHQQNQFRVAGEAEGIAIEIVDTAGRIATPGAVFSSGEIDRKAMRLNYLLRVASNHQPFKPGSYHSTIRFNITYY
ncbi:fimbrial protein [Winslowiella iniecta]|uniref:fimbrial protein n=1 Tax=Winslowiella iniecta TaxID=1560201 RepID=UPI00069FAA45|nr:fimbrial protein [Winslowiella iniecta]